MVNAKQVAEFTEVPLKTINSLADYNKEELSQDGYKIYKKDEVINLLNPDVQDLKTGREKTVVTLDSGEEISVPSRGLRLFPKRAILRVCMLLRDSEVDKEVRIST